MGALQAVQIPARPYRPIQASMAARDTLSALRRPEQKPDAGVHLPFLAPLLGAVRLRSNPNGLEFVLPNPSGGRGVYVAAWSVVAGFAAPNLHDTLLVGRLSGLDSIGPADVRQAARLVALDGHAGQEAADAARQAQDALDIAALRLRAQLLMSLARQGGFVRPEEAVSCMDRDGFNMLSARLGWRGPQLAEALQEVSVRYASVAVGAGQVSGMQGPGMQGPETQGLGTQPPMRISGEIERNETGRWGRLLSLVQKLRGSLAEEQFNRGGIDAALLGRIMTAADHCIRQCALLLPEIKAMLANPLPVLDAWRAGSLVASGWLHGLESILDGWDRICLLWFDARSPRLRQLLIPEIAALTRTSSSDGWSTGTGEPDALAGDNDGTSFSWERQRLTRNERIRAKELTFELQAA